MTGIDETTVEVVTKYFTGERMVEHTGYNIYAKDHVTKEQAKALRDEIKGLGWYKARNGYRAVGVGHYVYRHPESEIELNLYFGPGMVSDTAFFYRRSA